MQAPPPGFQLDTPQMGQIQLAPGNPYKMTQERNKAAASAYEPAAARSDTQLTGAQIRNAGLEAQLKKLQIEKEQAEAVAAAQKRQEAARAFGEVNQEMLNVIDATARAHKLSREKTFATGAGAPINSAIGKLFGGTSGADIDAKLNVVGSNLAFERLQKMRAQSPTGGALGNVTERELELLKSTIASLNTSQSDAEFQRNMKTVQDSYARVLKKLPGGTKALGRWRRQWIEENSPKRQGRQSGWSIEEID